MSRTVPLTGSDGMRLLAEKYGQIYPNEVHTTDDDRRSFLEGFLIGPTTFHGIVATTAQLLLLNALSIRGCFPNDTAYVESERISYACISNRGEDAADWIPLNVAIPITTYGQILIGDEDGNPAALNVGEEGTVLKSFLGGVAWGNINTDEITTISSGGEVLLGRVDSDLGLVQEIQLGANLEFALGKLAVVGAVIQGTTITNPGILTMNGASAATYKDGKLAGRASDGNDDIEEIECIPPLHCWLDPIDGPRLQLIFNTSHFEAVAGAIPAVDGFTFSLKLAPVTKGGTGLTTIGKGELFYGSATDTVSALAVPSTDGWLLTWNNTTKLPEWRASSGGGGGADFLTVQVFS